VGGLTGLKTPRRGLLHCAHHVHPKHDPSEGFRRSSGPGSLALAQASKRATLSGAVLPRQVPGPYPGCGDG